MVGPEGREQPVAIGPLLIWQQPHPIYYAKLSAGSAATAQRFKRYAPIVFESAALWAPMRIGIRIFAR